MVVASPLRFHLSISAVLPSVFVLARFKHVDVPLAECVVHLEHHQPERAAFLFILTCGGLVGTRGVEVVRSVAVVYGERIDAGEANDGWHGDGPYVT